MGSFGRISDHVFACEVADDIKGCFACVSKCCQGFLPFETGHGTPKFFSVRLTPAGCGEVDETSIFPQSVAA
jgi:hypothetical protein